MTGKGREDGARQIPFVTSITNMADRKAFEMFFATVPQILKRWKRALTKPASRPEITDSFDKGRILENRDIQFPSARTMRNGFRDRETKKNSIMIRKRTWNNRTGRHKMKPDRREANEVDTGGQGAIGS